MVWRTAGEPYAGAVRRVHRRWNENKAHDWCRVISNAQIVAAALLYGEGDFEKAVTRAVYPCFDTDCNGATVGSIMGMLALKRCRRSGRASCATRFIRALQATTCAGYRGWAKKCSSCMRPLNSRNEMEGETLAARDRAADRRGRES